MGAKAILHNLINIMLMDLLYFNRTSKLNHKVELLKYVVISRIIASCHVYTFFSMNTILGTLRAKNNTVHSKSVSKPVISQSHSFVFVSLNKGFRLW